MRLSQDDLPISERALPGLANDDLDLVPVDRAGLVDRRLQHALIADELVGLWVVKMVPIWPMVAPLVPVVGQDERFLRPVGNHQRIVR